MTPPETRPRTHRGTIFLGIGLVAAVLLSLMIWGSIRLVNSVRALVLAAQGYDAMMRGDDAEALRLHQEAVRLDDNQAQIWFSLGAALARHGRYEEAADAYGHAAQLSPGDRQYNAHYFEAKAYLAVLAGAEFEAELLYRKSLQYNAWNRNALLALGGCLSRTDRFDEAIQVYTTMLRWNSNDAEVHEHLALALQLQAHAAHVEHEYEGAIALYRESIEYAETALAWYNLGLALAAVDQQDDAIAALKESHRLDPDSSNTREAIGWLLHKQGYASHFKKAYETAIALYRESVDYRPQTARAWYNLGLALQALEQQDEALAAFEAALVLEPDSAKIRDAIGRRLHKEGYAAHLEQEHETAIALYRRTLEYLPENALAWYNLATALIAVKRYGEASEAIATAITIAPDSEKYRDVARHIENKLHPRE